MSFHLQIDKLLLGFIDRYTINSGLSKNDLLDIENQLISFLKQKPELKYFRHKLFNLLFKLKKSADELNILNEHDNFYKSMSIILSYFMELEIQTLDDPECDENNLDVFNRIFSYINYFLNRSEPNIVMTFVHYFIRDNNIMDLKEDPILKDLFCHMFEKLFMTPIMRNRPKGNELEFFSYLFIFKLWHFVCSSIEEKNNIERLIPLLYKFSTLSSFVTSKKYTTHNYYDNGSYIIMNIKDRILKMLKTDESANESLKQTKQITSRPNIDSYCPYTVPIKWLDKLSINSEGVSGNHTDLTNQQIEPNISDATTVRVVTPEASRNISDITTIQVVTPTNSRNISDISSAYVSSDQLSSNNIERNISSVSTVQLHYPENSKDLRYDVSFNTTLSVLNLDSLTECPSNTSFFTAANTVRALSSVSDASTVYVSCQNSKEKVDKTDRDLISKQCEMERTKRINPKSTSTSPRPKNLPSISERKSHIRIIERKDYIKRGNSRKRTFSMLRDELLNLKQKNASKRNNKILENGWKEIKQCYVKLKRIDDLELEALKNNKLPLEYFSRAYSNRSSNDEQKSENSIDLNNANISIEILEETLGSRAYLYCREVQKTLEKETKKGRKRAKSCFSY